MILKRGRNPELVSRFSRTVNGFDGYFVLDSSLFGPSCGGVRLSEDIDENEIRLLAHNMTMKNVFAGIIGGGAKLGIKLSPTNPYKREALRNCAITLRPVISSLQYIPSQDMGTTEEDILYMYDCIDAIDLLEGSILSTTRVGDSLPQIMTAHGVATALTTAIEYLKWNPPLSTVAIEGFGRVGSCIASELAEQGFTITAVSNKNCMIFHPRGLDIAELYTLRRKYGEKSLEMYALDDKDIELCDPTEIFNVETDILIPAAKIHVINKDNMHQIENRLIVPCANNPIDERVEDYLYDKGIIVVPDFVSNAGGVISGMAHRLGNQIPEIKRIVEEIIYNNLTTILKKMIHLKMPLRKIAEPIVNERIQKALRCKPFIYRYFMEYWYPYLIHPITVKRFFWYVNKRLVA